YLDRLRELCEQEPASTPASGLDAKTRHRMLYEWNDTAFPFDADGPVHTQFEAQAARRPDAIALRWRGGTMTYGELNRKGTATAWRLRELGSGDGRGPAANGVRPETQRVGISARRGPDMVAAVFGVLKAGGAYVPIEPRLPDERAASVLAD